MISREINEVFKYINESIRVLRAIKEEQQIDFNFDKIMSIYDNMLAEIDYAFDGELKIDRETKTEKEWSIPKIEDCIENINDWQIPKDLFLEDDEKEFQSLKNEFIAEWNELLD